MGGYAWVTLATNDSYSLGALVLAHSLKSVGTKHQLAVLITPGVTPSMREKLSSTFNVVKEVNVFDSKDQRNLRLLQRPELGITFTKLNCWLLTQYDKCVFLDADTLLLQNADELFERDEFSAAPDVGWPDCFNSGVFVYRPSEETYSKIVQFALEKGSFDGADQGLLNLYFSDWAHKDISKHLPFIYNTCSTACYSYMPAFKQFSNNIKIIHFIGNSKPWLQYFDVETRQVQVNPGLQHLHGIIQHWWNIFCSNVHPSLSPQMAGLAGAFAQLTLGVARTLEQSILEDNLRRQNWESGNIDYMGRDSFDNIWSKICQTLTGTTISEAASTEQSPATEPITSTQSVSEKVEPVQVCPIQPQPDKKEETPKVEPEICPKPPTETPRLPSSLCTRVSVTLEAPAPIEAIPIVQSETPPTAAQPPQPQSDICPLQAEIKPTATPPETGGPPKVEPAAAPIETAVAASPAPPVQVAVPLEPAAAIPPEPPTPAVVPTEPAVPPTVPVVPVAAPTEPTVPVATPAEPAAPIAVPAEPAVPVAGPAEPAVPAAVQTEPVVSAAAQTAPVVLAAAPVLAAAQPESLVTTAAPVEPSVPTPVSSPAPVATPPESIAPAAASAEPPVPIATPAEPQVPAASPAVPFAVPAEPTKAPAPVEPTKAPAPVEPTKVSAPASCIPVVPLVVSTPKESPVPAAAVTAEAAPALSPKPVPESVKSEPTPQVVTSEAPKVAPAPPASESPKAEISPTKPETQKVECSPAAPKCELKQEKSAAGKGETKKSEAKAEKSEVKKEEQKGVPSGTGVPKKSESPKKTSSTTKAETKEATKPAPVKVDVKKEEGAQPAEPKTPEGEPKKGTKTKEPKEAKSGASKPPAQESSPSGEAQGPAPPPRKTSGSKKTPKSKK